MFSNLFFVRFMSWMIAIDVASGSSSQLTKKRQTGEYRWLFLDSFVCFSVASQQIYFKKRWFRLKSTLRLR